MQRNCTKIYAFTLIELLVVIAVIALLLSITIPLLTRVKERARRVVCQSNIRSFHIAVTAYATNNDHVLPKGGIEIPYNYTIVMRRVVYETVGGECICPNLYNPWRGEKANLFKGGSYQEDNGYYLLGYNYLGGFPATPWTLTSSGQTEWKSPQKITENPRLPIIAELNNWIVQYKITFAPHGYWGPIHQSGDSTNESFNGIPSDQIGSAGGHICTLDGAIQWKDIKDMKIYRASADQSANLLAFW